MSNETMVFGNMKRDDLVKEIMDSTYATSEFTGLIEVQMNPVDRVKVVVPRDILEVGDVVHTDGGLFTVLKVTKLKGVHANVERDMFGQIHMRTYEANAYRKRDKVLLERVVNEG